MTTFYRIVQYLAFDLNIGRKLTQ